MNFIVNLSLQYCFPKCVFQPS